MSVVTKKPARSYTVRKPSTKKTATRKPARPAAKHANVYSGLPGWKDLAAKNERVPKSGKNGVSRGRITTPKFALLLLALATLFTLYVGHVHSTQELLADVQELRRENLRLHLKHNRVKGEYDRLIGPGIIYERAHAMGLDEGYTYGPAIRLDKLAD